MEDALLSGFTTIGSPEATLPRIMSWGASTPTRSFIRTETEGQAADDITHGSGGVSEGVSE